MDFYKNLSVDDLHTRLSIVHQHLSIHVEYPFLYPNNDHFPQLPSKSKILLYRNFNTFFFIFFG